jgi:steroid 5-alpha reductase family enzyme
MGLIQLYLSSGELVIAMMTALWLLSLVLKNSSIVDIFWGTGFVIVNLFAFYFSQHTTRQIILTVLVTLWGLRLTTHVLLRNVGKPEDFRYAQWREENGRSWWWVSFVKVFLLQGVILLIIASPLLAGQAVSLLHALAVLDYIGIMVWVLGFFFEAVGDYQLAKFKSIPSNKGKILTGGLWRYTRHPNYFGDSAQWWGFYFLAAASGCWWTIFSPVLMTILLLRVSGVTLLEKTMSARPGYEEYTYNTNAFVPWFPKK